MKRSTLKHLSGWPRATKAHRSVQRIQKQKRRLPEGEAALLFDRDT
jgi:hypothetical protein